jgi:hypothetical protein
MRGVDPSNPVMELTGTHQVILSAAAQRQDRGVELTPDPDPTTEKMVATLAGLGLIEEVEASGTLPVWRQINDETFALRITNDGLKVISVSRHLLAGTTH